MGDLSDQLLVGTGFCARRSVVCRNSQQYVQGLLRWWTPLSKYHPAGKWIVITPTVPAVGSPTCTRLTGLASAVEETRERLNHRWCDEYSDYGYPRRIIDSTTKASIIAILVV
jgi:hypothetical protein